ncbi:MAG: hypothetical protein COA47_15540 [Robiginitomaculum sp.]|nr:MAG: hypothetical protein COA47_15540 [Robiginitomaculum sp.]
MKKVLVVGFDHMIDKLVYLYQDDDKEKVWDLRFRARDKTKMSYFYCGMANYKKIKRLGSLSCVKDVLWADGIDVYMDDLLAVIVYIFYARLFNKKIAISFRGSDLGKWHQHNLARKFITKLSCLFAHTIFIKEFHMRNTLIHKVKIRPQKIVELHNAVPTVSFMDCKFSPDSKQFVYINSIRKERNVLSMIESFVFFSKNNNEEFKLRIIGATNNLKGYSLSSNDYLNECEELIEKLDAKNIVSIESFTKKPWDEIDSCFGFILVADVIWLNNSLLEALSKGIPVIVSDVEGANEITNFGKCGTKINITEMDRGLEQFYRQFSVGDHYLDIKKYALSKFSSYSQIEIKYMGLFNNE